MGYVNVLLLHGSGLPTISKNLDDSSKKSKSRKYLTTILPRSLLLTFIYEGLNGQTDSHVFVVPIFCCLLTSVVLLYGRVLVSKAFLVSLLGKKS